MASAFSINELPEGGHETATGAAGNLPDDMTKSRKVKPEMQIESHRYKQLCPN